ncbi:unnamed protein product [Musa banksii]
MAVSMRAKRVTDPLGEDARARLRGYDRRRLTGYASSGSDHEALSSLVHAFFECDDCDSPSAADAAAAGEPGDRMSDSDGGDQSEKAAAAVGELVGGWRKSDDPFRLRLLSDASKAADAMATLRSSASGYRRAVMALLREMGYDAGICKARWESSGNLVHGSYEYIDVVVPAAAPAGKEGKEDRRYIVDLGFAAEFKVARATEAYENVVAALPEMMVAQPEEVKQVVRMVGDAGRRSLKSQGLHVPPWRKGRYIMAKWLGPYRRTVNAVPASAALSGAGGAEAKCRAVGFTAAKGTIIC